MASLHRRVLTGFIIAACLTGFVRITVPVAGQSQTIPARFSDKEFWRLVSDLSEPDGNFRSDNLLSNELWYQQALPRLAQVTKPGRAYLGVGPEQNFAYALTLKPSVAFIVDIRRGNLDLHLMYKALFELSADRAEFVSRLFGRPRPAGLNARTTVRQLFDAYAGAGINENLYLQNLSDVRNALVTTHGFPLSQGDLQGIEYVDRAFFMQGPSIRYSPIGPAGGTVQPTYSELMTATDDRGMARGFLSSEAAFAAVKDMQARNLIVPVVGNFSGPKAIRAISQYLKDNRAMVSAFYVSNVEEYLKQDNTWTAFCANVRTLPLDDTSTFIRSVRTEPSGTGEAFISQLPPILEEIKNCGRNR